MHFTLPALAALSTLTLLTWHEALAVPVTLIEASKSQTFVLQLGGETPGGNDASEMLDSRSPSHVDAVADPATGGLQPRALPWTSENMYRVMNVQLPTAVATAIHVANGWVGWKFKMWYTSNSDNTETLWWTWYAPRIQDFDLCVKNWKRTVFGNNNGQYYVETNVDFEASWWDEISGSVLTMFWSAAIQFGQGGSYDHSITLPPTGYEVTTPTQPFKCLGAGGTSVNPLQYTFPAWTPGD